MMMKADALPRVCRTTIDLEHFPFSTKLGCYSQLLRDHCDTTLNVFAVDFEISVELGAKPPYLAYHATRPRRACYKITVADEYITTGKSDIVAEDFP